VLTFHNLWQCKYIGVTVFCGMEKVYVKYLMYAENQDFQTTDRFMAYFGPRLSQTMEN
jgi:hypothetical protein